METSSSITSPAKNSRTLAAGDHQAVDRIADVATHAAERIAEQKLVFNKARSDLIDDCRTYVGDNPALALGVAVAAGFLLRHLVRPR